jgi:hypothetical protein
VKLLHGSYTNFGLAMRCSISLNRIGKVLDRISERVKFDFLSFPLHG